MATVSAGVGQQDVMGAKQLNQQGLQGEAGLFGADTSAMLSSMGQESGDINSEVAAGNSGWYQQMLSGINTGANVMKGVAALQGQGSGGGGGGSAAH
jgi:hypothetical protein